jgi:metal-sulfur cluster biosynthetic enzyme
MLAPAREPLEELDIEVAAHRLVIRAILTYIACATGKSTADSVVQIVGMLEGTGPYAVPVKDMDPALLAKAIKRARRRFRDFAIDIQKLPIARN